MEGSSLAQFSDRFEREARAVAALNHPNIAQFYDVGENYIVMEYVEGAPVSKPDSIRRLLDIAVQIADGLAAAHAAGFVHRDLKPDNILLTREGRVKILDFGLAKGVAAATASTTEATRTIAVVTNPGTVMGTVAYMSPEQARGQAVDARSDQFSFGLMLYELATGKRAFERPSAAETMAAIIREEPAPLPDTIPAPVRWPVQRCLSKDAADRYDTTRDLYLELRALRERISEVSVVADVPAAVQAKRGIGRRFALPASIVVGAACIWWIAGAAQPWRPDVSKVRRIPFATEEYGESWATWSPDGRSIAYVGRYREPGENGVTDKLIIRSRDGSPPFVVARHDVIGQIAWPSDQSRLFYMATSKGKGEPDVYAVSTAGGAPTALLNSGIKVRALAISPDAKTLAVLRAVTVNDRVRTQLWLSSPPGSAPVQVQGFEGECCMQPFGLVWMPDGKSLLASIRSPESYGYWRIEARGGSRKIADQSLGYIRAVEPSGHYAILAGAGSLWWMNTATAARSLLMADTQWIGTPALSRDGRQLAFTVGRSRPYLIAVPLDGSPPRRLGMSQVDETDPEWCKRTGEFAFVRGSEIRVRSRDGAERVAFAPRNVPNLPETDALRFPAFSPDGERMAFTTEGSAMSNVYIAPVRGGQITPLHGGDEKDRPSWSPDGAWIAYDSPVRGVVTIKKIRVGSTDPPIELGRHECVPQWSPAGSSILCAAPHEGLLVLAADGKGERSLGTEYTPPAAWSQDGNAIYAIRKSGERRELVQIAVSSGAVRKIVEIPPDLTLPGFHDPPSFSMAPDGKSLAGISRDDLGDIWILEGFETPRTFWERLWPVKQ